MMTKRKYNITLINKLGDQCSQEVEIKIHPNDRKNDIKRKLLSAISSYLKYSLSESENK